MTDIPGWLAPNVAEAMRRLIHETRPRVCVEIGVFAGKSLINTAIALRDNCYGTVYGIDPWKTEEAVRNLSELDSPPSFWEKDINLDDVHNRCMENIWKRELDAYAIIIRACSQDCTGLFAFNSIDILYIDGGHSERQAHSDVYLYEPCVKSGGYIWFDDSDWPSTQKAQDLLLQHCDVEHDFGATKLFKKR